MSDWSFTDYEIYCMSLEKFNIIEKLGKGSIGKVMLAEYKLNGRFYALKFIDIKYQNTVLTGLNLSRNIIHTNLIRSYGYFFAKIKSENYIVSILEFFQGQDLYNVISNDDLFLNDVKPILTQLVEAIKYLHLESKLIHRDIKLENILINDQGLVKIVDYDFLTRSDNPDSKRCGTPFYASPEILNGNRFDYRTDLWSLGICLYIILVGHYPFDAETDKKLYDKILNKQPNYKNISKEYLPIVSGLLIKNQYYRLNYDDLATLLKEI